MTEGWGGIYDRTDSDVSADTGRGSMNNTEARIVKMLRDKAQIFHRFAAEGDHLRKEHIALASAYSLAADEIERGEHRRIEL